MIKNKTFYCMWCGYENPLTIKGTECLNCGSNQLILVDLVKDFDYPNCAILKISNKAILESMRKGEIWLQSPLVYQDYHDDNVISDTKECAYDYYDGINGIYKLSPYVNHYRLLCMTTLSFNDNGFIHNNFCNDFYKFGDSYSIIGIKELYEKISSHVPPEYAINLSTHQSVKYIQEKAYKGFYNPTCKLGNYSWQSEWRIILRSIDFNRLDRGPLILQNLPELDDCIDEPSPINELIKAKHISEIVPNWEEELHKCK